MLRRGVSVFKVNMALLRYLKPTDGLPDPKGSLSSSMHPQAIARANEEVREAMKSVSRKHGPYQVYSADIRAKIAKYASLWYYCSLAFLF